MGIKIGGIPPASRTPSDWIIGVNLLGDEYRDYEIGNVELAEVDCFFQFNINNPKREFKPYKRAAFEYILNSKKPFLVLEEGCFRQFKNYKRYGWWSYRNDTGIFNNSQVNDTRWKKFQQYTGLKIKPWKSKGSEILIMGQVPIDSAVLSLYDQGYKDFYHWLEETISTLRKHTDRKIYFRPHPGDFMFEWLSTKEIPRLSKKYKNIEMPSTKINDLYADLEKAYCVITFNSNSAVESLCEGIPIFALDAGSAAYDVAHHNLSQIENLNYNIDITNWCNKISYTVWSTEEVARGETWSHLKPVYFK